MIRWDRVGISGDLEAAIHATHHYISQNASDYTFALLKIDMKNTFNECSHFAFFTHIDDEFLEISAWSTC